MTRPLLIVQSSPTKQTALDLATAARARDWAIQDISFHRDEPQPPHLTGRNPVFVFGTVALLEVWAIEHPTIAPWIWYDHTRLSPPLWAQELGRAFHNHEGCSISAGDIQTHPAFDAGPLHVHPHRSDKKPPGKLYTRAALLEQDLDPDTALWVSPPRPILNEVRVWIVGGQVVTGSQYKVSGTLENATNTLVTKAALSAAASLAQRFLPHPHCVMDVGLGEDGNWRVIEFNPIHGAGWYAADPGLVLDAFAAHCG